MIHTCFLPAPCNYLTTAILANILSSCQYFVWLHKKETPENRHKKSAVLFSRSDNNLRPSILYFAVLFFTSLNTVPDRRNSAIRFGITIMPLNVSAMLQSSPRSIVAPTIATIA